MEVMFLIVVIVIALGVFGYLVWEMTKKVKKETEDIDEYIFRIEQYLKAEQIRYFERVKEGEALLEKAEKEFDALVQKQDIAGSEIDYKETWSAVQNAKKQLDNVRNSKPENDQAYKLLEEAVQTAREYKKNTLGGLFLKETEPEEQ